MALKSWLASLKTGVSEVSEVQATVYAALSRYPTEKAQVSEVSLDTMPPGSDTPDTPQKKHRYQLKPAPVLGCTPDTPDTRKKINTEAHAANDLPTTEPDEPKRLFRQRGPWLDDIEQTAANAYHAHHFTCRQCVAAGRGYGERCAAGAGLWSNYQTGTDE